MTNRLSQESSPYLRQHKDNPVDWYPWGPEALARAKAEAKPILLSIGYAACHWCHVMAHESFENEATAGLMNAHYINIKLDREERPDLDAIFQAALALMGEPGGWPLTMFLTPDGKPFTGGTYYPPQPRYGRPAFPTVLTEIARIWREEPARALGTQATLLPHLEQALNPADEGDLSIPALNDAAARLLQGIDPVHGGLSGAPKFPNVPVLELLWRAYCRTGNPAFAQAIETSLIHMCQGGLYDHVGGGFARYTVDATWLTPHFEKMLYDNAQLVGLLSLVWLKTKSPLLKARVEETVGWLIREMRVEGGGFASSLDADSEGHEGRFYVWTQDQIENILGAEEASIFYSAYGVSASGNFEGKTILNRLGALELKDEAHEARLKSCRERLFAARSARVRPARDDKVLAEWNGLMIKALAEAGAAFGRPDWITAARLAFFQITNQSIDNKRLFRTTGGAAGGLPGLAEDYAEMIAAALALTEATGETVYLGRAKAWEHALVQDFAAAGGAFHQSPVDAVDVFVRSRTIYDNAVPPANATMLANYARLYALTGDSNYRERGEAIVRLFAGVALRTPRGTASFLNAFEQIAEPLTIWIAGSKEEAQASVPKSTGALALVAFACPQPNRMVGWIATRSTIPEGHPAHGKVALSDQPTAYVCRGPVCSAPVSDPAALAEMLKVRS
jgi:hypothetical protein